MKMPKATIPTKFVTACAGRRRRAIRPRVGALLLFTGTGRFYAAHLAPLFFVLMQVLSHGTLGSRPWKVSSSGLALDRVQAIVSSD